MHRIPIGRTGISQVLPFASCAPLMGDKLTMPWRHLPDAQLLIRKGH
jgi:hypothetical protein